MNTYVAASLGTICSASGASGSSTSMSEVEEVSSRSLSLISMTSIRNNKYGVKLLACVKCLYAFFLFFVLHQQQLSTFRSVHDEKLVWSSPLFCSQLRIFVTVMGIFNVAELCCLLHEPKHNIIEAYYKFIIYVLKF